MKRQLERLKGKRLVTGDANLMTKNEICINATPNGVEVKEIGTDGSIKDIASGGSGGGTAIQYEYDYLKIDFTNTGTEVETFKTFLKSIVSAYFYTIYRKIRDEGVDNELVYCEINQIEAMENVCYIKTIKNIYPLILSWSDLLKGEVYTVEEYKELLGDPNLDITFSSFLKTFCSMSPDLGEEVYNKYCSIPTKEEMDEVIANTRYKWPLY